MEIIEVDPDYETNLRFQFYTRRQIVVSLTEKIENAKSLEDLKISPCTHQVNTYFTYDNICKLFFQHFPEKNQVKLWNFVFAE